MGQVGQLVVGVVGGVIGAFFGVPQLGFMLGSLAGSFLFPTKGPNQEGPRLDNLSVTSSTYGQPIFIIYGTVRVGGNIIWSKPIREQKTVTKQSGGKGGAGSSGKTTTYAYYWTGAVALGEGPIVDVVKIWTDTKIAYDRTGTSSTVRKPDFRFRVYYGDELQMPDAAIAADKGDANVTAHRGMAYIVFDDIPLKDYGNRVPSFTFEVVANTGGATATGVHGIIDLTSGPVAAPRTGILVPNWVHRRLYKFRDGDSGGIHVYNMETRKEIRQAAVFDVVEPDDSFSLGFGGEVAVDDDGFIYAQLTSGGANSRAVVKIDGFSLKEVARIGSSSSNLDPLKNIITGDNFCVVNAYSATGLNRYLVNCDYRGDVQFIHCGGSGMTLSCVTSVDEFKAYGVPGETRDGRAVCYLVGRAQFGPQSTEPFGIYRITVPGTAYLSAITDQPNPVFTRTKLGTISPTQVVSWWSYFNSFGGSFYDTHEGRLYLLVEGGRFFTTKTKYLVRYNPETASVEWAKPLTVSFSFTAYNGFYRVNSGFVSFVGDTNFGTHTSPVQTFNLSTGDSAETDQWDFEGTVGGAQTYDSQTGAIIAVGTTLADTGETNCIIYTGRASSAGANLGDIVTNLCGRVGLESSDIDVAELTDDVDGYVINNQSTVRSAIEPLALTFNFDGVESDDTLKFLKRGRASSLTLTQPDLKFLSDQEGEFLRETRMQEVELPERVSLVYLDPGKDYQQNTQTTKRISKPTPSMFSANQISNTIPVVMSASFAKQLSETLLYTSWIERIRQEIAISWEYAKLDPVDAVTINLDNGTVYEVRLTSVDIGADLTMELKSVNEKATSYSSHVPADGGDGFPQQVLPGLSTTKTFIMDCTLLRDSDDTGGTVSRMYAAGGGFGQPNWPGEQIEHSADGSFYNVVAQIPNESAWGSVGDALPGVTNPFATDEDNTITVFMNSGEDQLESITDLEMVNGANPAILWDEATGNLEVIQYRDVTQNDDGSYTLSGLLRGRRGTDTFVGSHVAGETLLLISADTTESFLLGLGELNVSRYYKGVPYGTVFEDAPLKIITSTGRDLKPYAPVNVAAAIDGSDIDLTWDRRTRIGGALQDGIGTVVLGETTEAYEVDIWNGAGDTVLRTLTSTTTTVTYLDADITTDFGSIPATLTVTVYQMSAAVGRGFGKKVTVDVE